MQKLFYVYMPKIIERKCGNRMIKVTDKILSGVFHSDLNARMFIAKQKAKGVEGYIVEQSKSRIKD